MLRIMASTGNLSAEIQESLMNFKVVIAFNRRDYFRGKIRGGEPPELHNGRESRTGK